MNHIRPHSVSELVFLKKEERKKEPITLLFKFVRVEFNIQEENALFHQNLTFPRDLQAIRKQLRHTFKSIKVTN